MATTKQLRCMRLYSAVVLILGTAISMLHVITSRPWTLTVQENR